MFEQKWRFSRHIGKVYDKALLCGARVTLITLVNTMFVLLISNPIEYFAIEKL